MLKFLCIVRPQKAEILCQQLLASGYATNVHAMEIRGRGRRGKRETEQGPLEYLPKISVICYAEAEHKEALLDLILENCRSGYRGDGKIFIEQVEKIELF